MAEYAVTQMTEDGYNDYLVFKFRCDLSHASSPVEIAWGGVWDATPFHSADGRRSQEEVALLLMQWVGGDWYSMSRPITVKEIDHAT